MDEPGIDSQEVPAGLYDQLLTAKLRARLDPRFEELVGKEKVEADHAGGALAQYLERLVVASLSSLRGKDVADAQRRLIDRVLGALEDEFGADWTDRFQLHWPLTRLLAVHAERVQTGIEVRRPETSLARSALLTGMQPDPPLASELSREFAAADRVDVLCSFIKWSGIRLLRDSLRDLTATPHPDGPRLRVITTCYMGATDLPAIEWLRKLPNTEVKISYDTEHTRLHAKAYLVHRSTGFGSSYIGSANLSRAALSEGLEWTSKISQYELPHLWQKIVATFVRYWNDEFEAYGESTVEKLREALARERREGTEDPADHPSFDLRPFPFQEEILDALAAEREVLGKSQHLIVAATGTGKTMISAFDYRRWAGSRRPSLLFIAHREELLRQALGTFRAVLRDHNFGELLVGGSDPVQKDHLFCSIQSYNSRGLERLAVDRFEYVVVDEFHHAAAPSYGRLLDRIQPKVLLGLTATPERADELDVFARFGGEATAEVRLPDAIERRLLCAFQYFGVADSVNLDGLQWQRGGYRTEDLDRVFTGNDVRAGLVLDKVRETLLDPLASRGLGFCVSIAHAEFMARFFNAHGLPSLALSADSPREDRRSAREQLVGRKVNFVFVVDLYNEGVDIPEVDTVLFLRPTESLTVFLQQLGRGLRLHQEKECLTVLDFIGSQHREFRFARRFRALSTDPTGRLKDEIEAGFPHLPPGCSIHLERVAQEHVLDNLRASVRLRASRVVTDLKELGKHLGRAPAIREALEYLDITLSDLLKRGRWSRLLAEAGFGVSAPDQDEETLRKGVRRIAHVDDPRQIRFLLDHLDGKPSGDQLAERRRTMLHVTLWGQTGKAMSLDTAERRLRSNAGALFDLRAILEYRLRNTRTRPTELLPDIAGPLALHAEYTRDEVLVGLGHWEMERRPEQREGVLHLVDKRVDVLFVTLHKSADSYSPTTMYEDYAISDSLFHWQSQSTTSAESETGKRYIHHKRFGYTPLLFVRESKDVAPNDIASPYVFLGPVSYVSHTGSKPMSIVWQVRSRMPARIARVAVA